MSKSRAAVLMYHAISEQRSAISIPPSLFRWQMSWLHKQNVAVVPLHQLINDFRQGIQPTKPTVVITFDDGFFNLRENAIPVLQNYNFPATIYLVTDYCGKKNDWPGQPGGIPRFPILNWDQVKDLDVAGIEFGVHTASHPRLDRVDIRDAAWEIQFGKQTLEEKLGHSVRSFAYPYGRFNQQVKELAAENFENACSTNLDFISASSDAYEIPRIDISYLQQPALFSRLFQPVGPLYLGIRKRVRNLASHVLARPW